MIMMMMMKKCEDEDEYMSLYTGSTELRQSVYEIYLKPDSKTNTDSVQSVRLYAYLSSVAEGVCWKCAMFSSVRRAY